MSTAATRKPPSGGVGRISNSDNASSPNSPPSKGAQRASTPNGHARTRSVRAGTPVSARAAAARREGNASNADADARAEASAAAEDLQKRLESEEKQSEQYKKQIDVLQSKLDDSVKDSAKFEEKVHEYEEQIEALKNERKDATRQIREMETIYETEKSSILKEKEEMANKEEEMQTIIQRLKDSLAQRTNVEDDGRPSRQANASPSLEGNFAPPSSLQRSDSRNNSKLILQKDKLIESLRLELAEAQIKLVESENQGGGRLQEVERLLMEARMANARLMEDNESYQLLLKERTLKGDLGQSDFSYMGAAANQDALNALEGNVGGSNLADELSSAAEEESEGDRRLEAELKSMKEQNKALTLYINKIIGRLLQHQDFESILDQSGDMAPPTGGSGELSSAAQTAQSLLQRAKSIATGPAKPKSRPASMMPPPSMAKSSAHNDPERAPSIPIGNLGRSASVRRSRPQSEQFGNAAGLVGQMYRGAETPASPTLGSNRHSHTFFSSTGAAGGTPSRAVSSSSQAPSSSGNFPGMRSETSSVSGDSAEVSTPPSQSPPRSMGGERQSTSFAGGKPRPLRLVQENADTVKDNKRGSWYAGWTTWAKKDEAAPTSTPIPE